MIFLAGYLFGISTVICWLIGDGLWHAHKSKQRIKPIGDEESEPRWPD